MPKLEASLP